MSSNNKLVIYSDRMEFYESRLELTGGYPKIYSHHIPREIFNRDFAKVDDFEVCVRTIGQEIELCTIKRDGEDLTIEGVGVDFAHKAYVSAFDFLSSYCSYVSLIYEEIEDIRDEMKELVSRVEDCLPA